MNITDWINRELYPTLYSSIDMALPEFDFKETAKGWISQSKHKITGEDGDSKGKVYVYSNNPGYIKDYTRDGKGILNYVMDRDNLEFIDAVKKLARLVNLTPPNSSNYDPEVAKKSQRKHSILEAANNYFTHLLTNDKQNGGAKRDQVLRYLTDERGYSIEDIKSMGLGYMPNQDRFNKEMERRGYTKEEIKEAIVLNHKIGDTHKLSIPFRSLGSLHGFSFRSINPEDKPKYLNSTFEKGKLLFGLSSLKGDKDLVLVEGVLDCLIAKARGVDNIAALTGTSLNEDQVNQARRKGVKAFTLCLDNDEAGLRATDKAIDVIRRNQVNNVYIVNSIEGKDPDQLIKDKGVEAFKEAISKAMPYYKYAIGRLLDKYTKLQGDQETLTDKQKDKLLEEIVETATGLNEIERDQFIKLFIGIDPLGDLGITEESLEGTIKRLKEDRDNIERDKAYSKALLDSEKIRREEGSTIARTYLLNTLREQSLQSKGDDFNKLLIPSTEEEIRKVLGDKPESLTTGYKVAGEDLLIPAGAISIIAAPTSHGKTTMLINMALRVVDNYPNKEVYIFSYEEDQESITINTLNTYMDLDLGTNNRRSLNSYFAKGTEEYIKAESREAFKAKKDQYFNLIGTNRLNIKYVTYNSDTIGEAIEYLKKEANPGAIFIDYFQLLNLPGGKYKTYSRQEELKQICLSLKDVAIDTGLPIVLAAQFNRKVTNPLHLFAHKIGEAGDIERIANLIIGMWNTNFKSETETKGEENEIGHNGLNNPGSIYVKILKNRRGKVGGTELLDYDGNRATIKNSDSEIVDNMFS